MVARNQNLPCNFCIWTRASGTLVEDYQFGRRACIRPVAPFRLCTRSMAMMEHVSKRLHVCEEQFVPVPELWWLLRSWTEPPRRAVRQGMQLLNQGY
jgi:hypothetical protein